jgi:hypothetical protein
VILIDAFCNHCNGYILPRIKLCLNIKKKEKGKKKKALARKGRMNYYFWNVKDFVAI